MPDGAPHGWRRQLRLDPIPALLACGDEALLYWVKRDLLCVQAGPVDRLWRLPEALRILRKQQPDGSWIFPGNQQQRDKDRCLVETWKQLRFLVEKYGFRREHPCLAAAAEFAFSCQTDQGDFRGFIANQYATYYTGALMSLLNQAGYEDDPRIEKGFRWLLSMRQHDMGWTIPILTHRLDWQTVLRLTGRPADPLEPDRSMPFSHNWTGMVLRAFATHRTYRETEEARIAASLLKSRFFQPDSYTSYHAAGYWVSFQYPFWWNNLVAALDSILRIDPAIDEPVERALGWFSEHQREDGLWDTTYVAGKQAGSAKAREMRPWVSLAICRVFCRIADRHGPAPFDSPANRPHNGGSGVSS
ncbi:MAG TPA: hypothetical protein PKO09_08345 [Anaerolineae bacterium]|nr:hypothetical protein [Anaerolineae bacterium]